MGGFDVVGAANGIWQSQYGVLSVVLLLLFLVLWSSGFFNRLFRIVEEMMFRNWQLALLGATAIALSLASGYTTFDGLRNFTSAPLLSVLIAFGIQGVMLIVAWLIGESFATGMNHRATPGAAPGRGQAFAGMALGVALVALIFYWTLERFEAVGFARAAGVLQGFHADWERFSGVALYFAIAVVLVATIHFFSKRGGDITGPYAQSVRIIARNAVLWVMFLAAMGASVFFSFDSHFNAIFPADQRKRAAEVRTENQVGRIVVDIGERARRVQLAELERLFESAGWKAYDAQLGKLTQEAQGAQAEIEKYFVQKMEDRRRGIIEQQERIAGAERGQTALLRKRDEAEAELQRLEPGIGQLEAELAKAQATYDETRQAVAAKRIDASAEDGGVEGTLKRGKGPVYRQRASELDELQRKLTITDEPRFKEAQKQRDRASARIVGLKREIATINGEVAKYKGEAHTAEQRIKTAEGAEQEADSARIDPARVLPAFERARIAFRQQPDTERLAALQAQCGSLVNAMLGTPAKDRVRSIDCDPREAAEAAGRVFALNAGLAAFQARCAGGEKLPQNATTDALLAFGRQCLQDSGLVSREAEDLGGRLQFIEMNRDDKAHRFVVTWNAVLDGNRLAYLAMTLAIGVDLLVFMAGLFGAAAVKSPLSDVPSPKARSADQLEAIVKNALGEERLENAELVLGAMRPMLGLDHRSEVDLTRVNEEHARRIRKVLVAGASIGAVERAPSASGEERYLVRSELFEYLSVVANSARDGDREYADRVRLEQRLEQIVGAALGRVPERPRNAETVLQYMDPINQRHSFMAKVDLPDDTPKQDRRLVMTVLNAGMTVNAVQRHDRATGPHLGLLARFRGRQVETTYLIRAELFKTLLLYSGSTVAELAAQSHTRPVLLEPREERVAIPPPRREPPHANSHTGNGHAHDEELRARFRRGLLRALELSPEVLEEQEVAGEAMSAAAELKRQAAAHDDLGRALGRVERESRRALDNAVRRLADEHEDDDQARHALDETSRDMVQMLPALMMLPERRLFDDLVEAIGGSSEPRLRKQLEELRDSINEMNAAEGAAWRVITRQLKQLSSGAPAPTHPGDGKVQH